MDSNQVQRRFLIVGTGGRAARLHEAWRQSAPLGWKLLGFVGAFEESRVGPILGPSSQLLKLVKGAQVTDVVLAPEEIPTGESAAKILQLLDSGIKIIPIPLFYATLMGRIPVAHIGELWDTIVGSPNLCRGLYLLVKRSIDLVVAGVALVPLAMLSLPLVLAIKLDSKGTVFEFQERVRQ